MEFLKREKRLREQSRELKQLRVELQRLRAQNESMRVGMRRCITCEFRVQARICLFVKELEISHCWEARWAGLTDCECSTDFLRSSA